MTKSVLLDTSFFLRLLNEQDALFNEADRYFNYFLNSDSDLYISTISIAEYCVKGSINELPMRNLKVIPFNITHAMTAGQMAQILFNKRKLLQDYNPPRNVIPNDTKLFAQASSEKQIKRYLTSDKNSFKNYQQLSQEMKPDFDFIDLNLGFAENEMRLDL